MQVIYKLDKQDIIKALAEHFGTTYEKVDLRLFSTLVGYGPGETEVYDARAEIEVEER